VRIVDLSRGGALVEGERPLRPGARVHVQVVVRAGTFSVTARILRCAVSALDPSAGATYRGALQFENRCEPIWESSTPTGADVPGLAMPDEGGTGQRLPVAERLKTMMTRGGGK
jgi:hypothetical protein